MVQRPIKVSMELNRPAVSIQCKQLHLYSETQKEFFNQGIGIFKKNILHQYPLI